MVYLHNIKVRSSFTADAATLEPKPFRYPKICFEDKQLSPMSSQSSLNASLSAVDTVKDDEEYPEFRDESDEIDESETEDDESAGDKNVSVSCLFL